ncbi:MAG: hypothetical protein M1825_000578 [Sarcosagium campestre]|nr:MAG: hypothetical protein M1825_000578 [Sarcosagium campestre]
MSRHRIVKNLDLDDELDDYDGGDYYDGEDNSNLEESESEEASKARLEVCAGLVQERLKLDQLEISLDEIRESVWYYYFDVEKSITWLKNKHTKQAKKLEKAKTSEAPKSKRKNAVGFTMDMPHRDNHILSASDYFKGIPWLGLPDSMKGEVIIEPLLPRGGLLGGSSASSGQGKSSKLAALAAARRKRDDGKRPRFNENEDRSNPVTSPRSKTSHASSFKEAPRESAVKQGSLPMPSHQEAVDLKLQKPDAAESEAVVADVKAKPSSFATTMIGSRRPLWSSTHGVSNAGFLQSQRPGPKEIAKNIIFTGPSPDDVVSAAQASKGSKTGKQVEAQAYDEAASVNGLSSGLKKTILEESSRVKSKNIDVLAEYEKHKDKNSVNFVVIGHVDHGKSTLMGRLLYDLNVVPSRTVDKYRKEAGKIGKSSFALAWVLDQTEEERDRGVTMDIATNQFETDRTKFTILDAPGHRDFVPNMIAGASQADIAVLVIDGSPNAFESGLKGQTKEHSLLVRSMGVQQVIVAVNKLDLVDWSMERFHEVRQQTLAFLIVAGFQNKNVHFVPCSGLTGDNVTRRADSPKAAWYSGPTLVELLDDAEPLIRALETPLRMTIGDIFRGGVTNPLSVSGRLESGTLQVGEPVLAMPSDESAHIKGVEVENQAAEWAVAGQIVTLHLTDIDPIHLKTGDVLCSRSSPIQNIKSFTAKILAFTHIIPMDVDMHRGRLHTPGRISKLVATLDKSSGVAAKRKPRVIQPGTVARVVIETDQRIPLEAPARIVLRANGETIAAGLVE